MKAAVLLFIFTLCAPAQHLSFGIKGGFPLSDAFRTGTKTDTAGNVLHYAAETRRYTVGPMAELQLPMGIGIEADALYRPLRYSWLTQTAPGTLFERLADGSAWDFPITGKFRLPSPVLKPYGELGVAFRGLTGGTGGDLNSQSKKGFVLGAGIELNAPFVRLAPELRYTRWGANGIPGLLVANQNQAEFLIGLSFH